jgi:hypothetical protein
MTEPTTTKPVLRKVYNPADEWLSVAESLEIFLEEAAEPHSRFEYKPDGIKRIPYTNKQWVNYTGTETPPNAGMVWLKPGKHYKAKDRLIHVMPIKYYRGYEWRIIWCMVRNTLLCKLLASVSVRLEAVKDTIAYYLKDYTDCPISLIERVSSAIGFTAMTVIDSHAECTASELAGIESRYATTRGAVDYECRQDLWNMLKNHGIGSLRTRKQQEALIDKILLLPKFSHLSKNIKGALLFRLRRNHLLKPNYDKIKDRVSDIKLKQLSNIPLTASDRQYVHRHKELFTI